MNRIQQMIEKNIDQYGIALQYVFPTEEDPGPAFLYTIGMTNIGAPELIVFGLDPHMMMPIFNQIFDEIRKGFRPKKAEVIADLMSVPLLLHPVSREAISEFGVQCLEYYKHKGISPKFCQVLWPDTDGKYPHEKGFQEHMRQHQPYIGTPPTLKLTDQSEISTGNRLH